MRLVPTNAQRLARPLSAAVIVLATFACSDAGTPTLAVAPLADVVASTPQTTDFASGTPSSGSRDEATVVVSVNDPYATAQLGSETVPFPAYLITPHPAYGSLSGAAWIGPYPNSGSLQNTTHDAQYTLEREIAAPAYSTPTTLSVRLLADNAVTVYLDGVQFGQQPQADVFPNFQTPTTFTTLIGTGTHTLSFWLRNGVTSPQGGPVGLAYVATITWTCIEGFGPSNGQCVPVTCNAIEILVRDFTTDAMWEKKLAGRLRNICDKVGKDSPATDEQVKNFNKELNRAVADGAISPSDAQVLSSLVQGL